jgi:hypothetical protein
MRTVPGERLLGLGPRTPDERAQLDQLVAPAPQPDEARMLAYLDGGVFLSATCLFQDHFQGGKDVTALAFLTDGTWLWTNALAYYVRHYHFRVPGEFVEHMRRQNWQVPPEDSFDADAILSQFHGDAD